MVAYDGSIVSIVSFGTKALSKGRCTNAAHVRAAALIPVVPENISSIRPQKNDAIINLIGGVFNGAHTTNNTITSGIAYMPRWI